jgi:GDSL-like Lipase/Acylhydrolase family
MRRSSTLRTVVIGTLLAGLLSAAPAVPAAAASPGNRNPNNYLAMGDSVPFGFNPLLVQPGVNPDVFVGYPQLASDLFRPRKKLFNASCPGETSTSLITGTRPDEGCQDYRQFIGPLHVAYSGSQLEYAEGYVAAYPRTGLITMMIGANDLFLLLDTCAGDFACVANGLPGLLDTLKTNLTTIYTDLRQSGFRGDFVAVTYYSLDYSDPVGTAVIEAIDGVLANVTQGTFGGTVADGFGAFKSAAAAFGGDSCAAGLLIHLSATECDVHPSPAGAALLAKALRSAV